MPYEKNLIPMPERTEDEQREICRKGGIASGVARRRKRSLKEAADLLMSMPVSDKRLRNKIVRMGLQEDDVDYQMAAIAGLLSGAIKGDSRAASVLLGILDDDTKTENEGVQIIDDV